MVTGTWEQDGEPQCLLYNYEVQWYYLFEGGTTAMYLFTDTSQMKFGMLVT